MILASPSRSIYLHRLRERLGDEASRRVVVMGEISRGELMRFQREEAAVALDTFPVGGGITSLELVAGDLCVVALGGGGVSVIRTTEAVLRAGGGSGGTVAEGVEEYVEAAVRIVRGGLRCDGGKVFEVERADEEVREVSSECFTRVCAPTASMLMLVHMFNSSPFIRRSSESSSGLPLLPHGKNIVL